MTEYTLESHLSEEKKKEMRALFQEQEEKQQEATLVRARRVGAEFTDPRVSEPCANRVVLPG